MFTNDEQFALINVANIKSDLLKDNFITSYRGYKDFINLNRGLPILVPASKKLFHFSKDDVFEIEVREIMEEVYCLNNPQYIGLCHAYPAGKFLSSFTVRDTAREYMETVMKKNNAAIKGISELCRRYKTVGAFQTRNIPHLGHEKIIEEMLKRCQHLVINPVIGPKKAGDVSVKVLELAYGFLKKVKYRNKISFIPIYANMFYAGPKEALHHALLRQKMGFTHFSVGRDHAGAENAYNADEAGKFLKFQRNSLNIKMFIHRGVAFCKKCKTVEIVGACGHSGDNMIDISGSSFRSALCDGNHYEYADISLQKYLLEQEIRLAGNS